MKEWIEIQDRSKHLPQYEEETLALFEDGRMEVVKGPGGIDRWWYIRARITHWMELPDPPRDIKAE